MQMLLLADLIFSAKHSVCGSWTLTTHDDFHLWSKKTGYDNTSITSSVLRKPTNSTSILHEPQWLEWKSALLIYKININSISVALSLCLCACCPSLSLPVFVCPICVNGCSLSSSGLHGEEEVVWLRSWSCSTPWWKHSQTRPLIGFRADDLSVLKNTLKPDLTPVQVHCFSQ